MAGSLNKVQLIGNVGADPIIRSTSDNKEIATLSLATSESWKDRTTGEKKEKTEWHRVVVFVDALVNIIKNYVKKGNKLYIEGTLQTRKWVDNSGQEKYTTEIVLQNFNAQLVLLDSKNASSHNEHGQASTQSNTPNFDHNELDDDIPF